MDIIRSDGLLATVAGFDTTATTFMTMWYYLLLNPTKFDRLQKYVDAYFRPGEEPLDFTRMVNMPYLNPCM
jgi:cytochrome P450